jgi:carbonic anhydrase
MRNSYLNQSTDIRQEFFEKNNQILSHLAQHGQQPAALFIGCSDSRVTPEQLFGLKPGEMFMLRNIANIIPPYAQTEIAIASVLEFAVLTLQVPHIIVCGHTDCGGIKGLDQHIDMITQPALSRWLSLARPAQHDVDRQQHDLSPEERHEAIVEQNVILQLHHLHSYPIVQNALQAHTLTTHGWVYDLHQQHMSVYHPESTSFVIE